MNAGLLSEIFAARTVTVLITTDLDGAITRFNPGAAAVVGVSEVSGAGRTPLFFLDEAVIASSALALVPTRRSQRWRPVWSPVTNGNRSRRRSRAPTESGGCCR